MIAEQQRAVELIYDPVPTVRSQVPRVRVFLLVLAVVLLNSFGDLLLAWGMRQSAHVGVVPIAYLKAMANPFVELGICLLVLWMLTRMALLSWADLSFVLPVTGTAYILAAVLGKVFLHEIISGVHWFAICLIFVGTAVVGTTNQKTPLAETDR